MTFQVRVKRGFLPPPWLLPFKTALGKGREGRRGGLKYIFRSENRKGGKLAPVKFSFFVFPTFSPMINLHGNSGSKIGGWAEKRREKGEKVGENSVQISGVLKKITTGFFLPLLNREKKK